MKKHKIIATAGDGSATILFSFRSNKDTAHAKQAIKMAVTQWATEYESGEEAISEVKGFFNWGDLAQNHEVETLKTCLKIFGIRKMKSEVLTMDGIADIDEVLFLG